MQLLVEIETGRSKDLLPVDSLRVELALAALTPLVTMLKLKETLMKFLKKCEILLEVTFMCGPRGLEPKYIIMYILVKRFCMEILK